MPPPKGKDFTNAPVFKMKHEEQVQLLSDALLREYMHRRGFMATLKAFDDEHPRDSNTISSRALMADLMALQPGDQQRMKAEGIETIMEMLCNLRVERRLETEKLTDELQMPLPSVPPKYEVLKNKQIEREARKAERQHHRHQISSSSKKTRPSRTSDAHHRREFEKKDEDTDESDEGAEYGPHMRSLGSRAKGEKEVERVRTLEDLLGSSRSSSNSSSAEGIGENRSSRDDDATQRGTTKDVENQSGVSSSSTAMKAQSQPSWMEVLAKGKGTPQSHSGGDGSTAESTDNMNDDQREATSEESGDDDDYGGEVLSAGLRSELSTAFQLLCGFDGSLGKDFLTQGFSFDNGAADCFLIQWSPGGCDAVIAPIQAFVAAYYYEREVYATKEQRQVDCLVKALCTVLEQAQPNVSKIVLVDSAWGCELRGNNSIRYTRSQMSNQAAKTRTRCWTAMRTMQEVARVLRETLLTKDRWMSPRGSGILSFVFSLLLSREVDTVQRELTAAAASGSSTDGGRPSLLIPSSGCATLGLANLVLTGRITFYRHNGVQNGSQVGYTAKLRCGMLCGDADQVEGRSEPQASPPASYTHATVPAFPSWVVWHRGSFANLFMKKDMRQVLQQKLNLGGNASVELIYWDAATEDDEVMLTVTVRSMTLGTGSGGARNARSFVNTAITSVPGWSSALIEWHDKVPLRDSTGS